MRRVFTAIERLSGSNKSCGYRGSHPLAAIFSLLLVVAIISVLTCPLPAAAFDGSLEIDLQSDLARSKVLVESIRGKLPQGVSVTSEITQLKATAENIKISNLLIEERFKLREEKAKTLGSKALERHQAMAEGYRKALAEYLSLVDSLPRPVTRNTEPATLDSATRDLVNRNTQQLLDLLKRLLPKKKRPIIGSLPYKHLNYPALEPSTAPAIIPAYKGGNKTVSPDDTKSTDKAPISKEIAGLAQSLNWNPVSIYEYVKNTIETEWYWGCMKGAEETLRQKSGNDCDQAALLTALFRASGFPTRYVRGSIEFFAGGKELPINRVRNLTGIDDPWKIAGFFQKAGIPYKPVIAGGTISNFQIEHVWVESQIPYANYRGAIIDEHGKTWLGLDTAIKTTDYVYNNAKDIFEEPGVSSQLAGIRDEYMSAVQPLTPLEYLQASINSTLTTQNSQLRYEDFPRSRSLPEDHLKILPYGMQFVEKSITGEYTSIPDDLVHTVKFTAINPQPATGNELFSITLPHYTLSNQQIAITYEPETVEDQEIINSYGGLDNTPSYLVRLRPVLKIDGERIVVARDGLPMGTDYNLTIELYSPSVNEGATPAETITNTLIAGNLSVIGIVAQKPVASAFTADEKDAERLLYEAANHYTDRWNQAEDELASLLHLTIARPLPTVVTVGGVIDVTYLLDMPHGFTWKGVYVDADVRAVEAVQSSGFEVQSERQKIFMQLSSLQGSILENRIFEDDFQVASISTAKLFQIIQQGAEGMGQRVGVEVIDKTNINDILPALPFDENIKEDITNGVNQNYTIRIPQSEMVHQDWTGIGYIKENPETGESGWMLSGMIAGGMTAWDITKWNDIIAGALSTPYSEPPNYDPTSARYIRKISATDMQNGDVGTTLARPLKVKVFDQTGKGVKNAVVTFTVKAGGGTLKGDLATGPSVTAKTNHQGIASVTLTLGQKTSDNPTFLDEGKTYSQQVGENIVDATLPSGEGITMPFTALSIPKEAHHIKPAHGHGKWGTALSFAGFVSVSVEDIYDNPVSNVTVTFKVADPVQNPDQPNCPWTAQDARKTYLAETDLACINEAPTYGTCGLVSQQTLTVATNHTGAAAQVILGGMEDAIYSISAAAPALSPVSFSLYTYDLYALYGRTCDNTEDPLRQLFVTYTYSADQYGNSINAGKAGTTIPVQAKLYSLVEGETTNDVSIGCGSGTLTCSKVVGSRQYDTTSEYINSSVTFSGVTGTAQGGGSYTANYTLKPGLNAIDINGTASLDVQSTQMACPSTCTPTTLTLTQNASTIMQVYGVDIQVDPIPIIRIDRNGYAEQEYSISYAITPAEYKASSAYVMLYKNTEIVASIPSERQGEGFATISRGFQFDVNSTYYAQVVLNYETGVEIRSDKIPLKIIMFKVVRPTETEKILIKNDNNGDPKMPVLSAEVELKGSGIDASLLDLTSKKICWQFKVEYKANITKSGAEYRSRKGLNCDGQGVCNGSDGYFIPVPDPSNSENGCRVGPTFSIEEGGNNGAEWGSNFGGGTLAITAKTEIAGTSVADTYAGAIHGQKNGDDGTNDLVDTKFKEYISKYLEAPSGVPYYQTEILDVLGHNKIFRIIAYHESAHTYAHFERLSDGNWKNLGPVLGYSSDYVFPLLNKSGKWSNPSSDGGFGLMQLTIPAPSYLQIWNWKENINGGVNLIKDKLRIANRDLRKNPPSTDTFGKSMLRMETYFLYGPSYKDKGIKTYWILDEKGNWVFSTEDWLYADTLREIEDAVDAGNYSLTEPDMSNWKYPGE